MAFNITQSIVLCGLMLLDPTRGAVFLQEPAVEEWVSQKPLSEEVTSQGM